MRLRLPRSGGLTFAAPAAFVVGVSLLITLRRGDAAATDPARFSGSVVVQRLPSLLGDMRLGRPVTVAVVRDEAAASFYDSAAVLDSIVEGWRRVLTGAGARVVVVRSSALAPAAGARVLVIPSSPCLTIATRALIERAAARGTGIVLTGRVGVHDAACLPIGFGFLVATTGASRAATLENRDMVYVTVPSGSPLSTGMPPGSRIDLRPASQVALRRQGRDAFYSDYALHPQPAENEPLLDGAVTRSRYGKSRVVWWGFDLHDVVDQPWSRQLLRLLARNSVAWAAALPTVSVEPWPLGKLAAAAIAQDVEDRFANARHALDSLRAAGAPGTYFLTSKLAIQHRRLVRELREAGEIGTHSENHRLLGGLPFGVQRKRLAITQDDIRALIGTAAIGLRPPQEQFDGLTMAAWLASGGEYLFGANDSRSAGPELLAVGRDTLVLLGRVGGDDFAIIGTGHDRDTTVAGIARRFLDDYERMRALGGMFLLSYHSQLLGRPQYVPALARVARVVAADTATWLTTAGRIAKWWRARAGLGLRVAQRRADRVDVTIENRGWDFVQGAVARVQLATPERVSDANVAVLPSEPGELRFLIPTMEPRSTLTATVLFRGARGVARAAPAPRSRQAPAPRRRWYEFWKR